MSLQDHPLAGSGQSSWRSSPPPFRRGSKPCFLPVCSLSFLCRPQSPLGEHPTRVSHRSKGSLLLQSIPVVTVPLQFHPCQALVWLAVPPAVLGAGPAGWTQPAVHKLLQSSALSSMGPGAGADSDSTCQPRGWELIHTKKGVLPFAGRYLRPDAKPAGRTSDPGQECTSFLL